MITILVGKAKPEVQEHINFGTTDLKWKFSWNT
jgi:hypothetical protein